VTDFNLASEMTPGATAVTISDTEQAGAGAVMVGGTAVASVVVVNGKTITAVTPSMSRAVVVTTADGTGILTDGFTL
jgi:hypothetical protein